MVNRKPQAATAQLLLEGVKANNELKDAKPEHDLVIRLADVRNIPERDELRRNPEEMAALAASLAEAGQDERIEVSLTDDGGWHIENGRHRCFALLRMLKAETVKARLREDMTPQERAVARCIGNDLVAHSLAYEAAVDYATILERVGTVAKLAKVVGKSEATVAFRLSLLKLEPAIGQRVGRDISNDAAEALLELKDHPEILQRVQATLPPSKKLAKQPRPYLDEHSIRQIIVANLTQGKDAVAADLSDQSLGDYWDRQDPAVVKEAAKLPKVQLGHRTLYLEPAKLRGLVEQAAERRKARDAKDSTKPRSASDQAASRKRRLDARLRRLQLELMVKHVKSRTSWGDDLLKAVYRLALRGAGGIAHAQADVGAIKEVSGITLGTGRPDPRIVDRLWAKDRETLDRHMAAVLFLSGRNYTGKTVTDDELAKLTTGMTHKAAEQSARKAMDAKADRKANPRPKRTRAAKAKAPADDEADEE